jgi:hypothetical protein
MRSRTVILMFLSMSFATPGICQDHPQHAARPIGLRPDGGTFIAGVYKNGYFGFSFALGEGWFTNDDLLQAGRVAQHKQGQFLLLMADRHAGKPVRENMLLTADDTTLFKSQVKLDDWVRKLAGVLVKKGGMELTRDAYAVDFAGNHFYRADLKESYAGRADYKSYLANEYDGFLFTWEFQADSEERLNQIVNSLNTLTFVHGHN